jgi:hypothetical protein
MGPVMTYEEAEQVLQERIDAIVTSPEAKALMVEKKLAGYSDNAIQKMVINWAIGTLLGNIIGKEAINV